MEEGGAGSQTGTKPRSTSNRLEPIVTFMKEEAETESRLETQSVATAVQSAAAEHHHLPVWRTLESRVWERRGRGQFPDSVS